MNKFLTKCLWKIQEKHVKRYYGHRCSYDIISYFPFKLSVILLPQWNENTPYIQGGPFEENYVFSRIHFHWGQGIHGSEHTVDGVRYVQNIIIDS